MASAKESHARMEPAAPSLTAKAQLRLEHAGRWVAWDHKETNIVASGDDPVQVRAEAERLGYLRVILDWIPEFPEPRQFKD